MFRQSYSHLQKKKKTPSIISPIRLPPHQSQSWEFYLQKRERFCVPTERGRLNEMKILYVLMPWKWWKTFFFSDFLLHTAFSTNTVAPDDSDLDGKFQHKFPCSCVGGSRDGNFIITIRDTKKKRIFAVRNAVDAIWNHAVEQRYMYNKKKYIYYCYFVYYMVWLTWQNPIRVYGTTGSISIRVAYVWLL